MNVYKSIIQSKLNYCNNIKQQTDSTLKNPNIYIYIYIYELLNEIVNEQKPTKNISDGNLIFLQKTNKLKGNIKNLRPIILLSTIRKILSTKAFRRIRNDVDTYLSASQSGYNLGSSTSDKVSTHKWLRALIQKNKKSFKILELDLSSAFDIIDRSKLM